VVLLMVRFAIPLAVLGTDVLWQKFMAADYASTQLAVDGAAGQAVRLNPPAAANSSFLERAKEWITNTTDVKARFDDIRQTAERVTEHIVKLMVIFLLQTLIIPLLLLWLLYAVLKGVLGSLAYRRSQPRLVAA
jgi:hypothetical protein